MCQSFPSASLSASAQPLTHPPESRLLRHWLPAYKNVDDDDTVLSSTLRNTARHYIKAPRVHSQNEIQAGNDRDPCLMQGAGSSPVFTRLGGRCHPRLELSQMLWGDARVLLEQISRVGYTCRQLLRSWRFVNVLGLHMEAAAYYNI